TSAGVGQCTPGFARAGGATRPAARRRARPHRRASRRAGSGAARRPLRRATYRARPEASVIKATALIPGLIVNPAFFLLFARSLLAPAPAAARAPRVPSRRGRRRERLARHR